MGLRFPFLAACASFACIGASGGSASDEGDKTTPPSEIDSVVSTPETGERAKDYWTVERMRNAKPMPGPVLDPNTMKPVESEDDPE